MSIEEAEKALKSSVQFDSTLSKIEKQTDKTFEKMADLSELHQKAMNILILLTESRQKLEQNVAEAKAKIDQDAQALKEKIEAGEKNAFMSLESLASRRRRELDKIHSTLVREILPNITTEDDESGELKTVLTKSTNYLIFQVSFAETKINQFIQSLKSQVLEQVQVMSLLNTSSFDIWKIQTPVNPGDISMWACIQRQKSKSNAVILELCLGLLDTALDLSPFFYSDLTILVSNDKQNIIENEDLRTLIEIQKVTVETANNRLKVFISDLDFHDRFFISVTYNGEDILHSPLNLTITNDSNPDGYLSFNIEILETTRKGKTIGVLDSTKIADPAIAEQSLIEDVSMTEWKNASTHYDWVFTDAKLIDLSTDRFKLKFSRSLSLPEGCLPQSVAVKHEHIFVSDMKHNAIYHYSQLRLKGMDGLGNNKMLSS